MYGALILLQESILIKFSDATNLPKSMLETFLDLNMKILTNYFTKNNMKFKTH